MPKQISAGLLMYRLRAGGLEVFLVHPGGPFFKNKDEGYWSIPKGLIDDDESPLAAARREFQEETGLPAEGEFRELGSVKQRSGKVVNAWAFEGEWDPTRPIESNTFEIEWPPRSGQRACFPEVDRAAFFPLDEARRKVNVAQTAFIDRLEELLGRTPPL